MNHHGTDAYRPWLGTEDIRDRRDAAEAAELARESERVASIRNRIGKRHAEAIIEKIDPAWPTESLTAMMAHARVMRDHCADRVIRCAYIKMEEESDLYRVGGVAGHRAAVDACKAEHALCWYRRVEALAMMQMDEMPDMRWKGLWLAYAQRASEEEAAEMLVNHHREIERAGVPDDDDE